MTTAKVGFKEPAYIRSTTLLQYTSVHFSRFGTVMPSWVALNGAVSTSLEVHN
ncbi:MAG: hypothetical protein RMX65_031700 [Nostoc sp. DedQUE01]